MSDESQPDRLYFLPKDPHWTFLWWEVSSQTTTRAAVELGVGAEQLVPCLRIYDVTDIIFDGCNSHSHLDIVVEGTDHWYLWLAGSGRDYCAEFGFKHAGCFLTVLRSHPIRLPSGEVSEKTGITYSTIR